MGREPPGHPDRHGGTLLASRSPADDELAASLKRKVSEYLPKDHGLAGARCRPSRIRGSVPIWRCKVSDPVTAPAYAPAHELDE
ncbi:hypothetical protein SVIOM74S_05876 [Streptomyces violarus]